MTWGCEISKNRVNAIVLAMRAEATIRASTTNGLDGIYVEDATATIADCTIDGNTEFGIYLYNERRHSAAECRARKSVGTLDRQSPLNSDPCRGNNEEGRVGRAELISA